MKKNPANSVEKLELKRGINTPRPETVVASLFGFFYRCEESTLGGALAKADWYVTAGGTLLTKEKNPGGTKLDVDRKRLYGKTWRVRKETETALGILDPNDLQRGGVVAKRLCPPGGNLALRGMRKRRTNRGTFQSRGISRG